LDKKNQGGKYLPNFPFLLIGEETGNQDFVGFRRPVVTLKKKKNGPGAPKKK